MDQRPGEEHESAVPSAATRYCVGDLLIDTQLGRVTREGREIPLGKVSFDLLIALVRGAPGFVPVESLMEQVWSGTVVGPETLSQRVKLLRSALDDDAKKPRYVAGVRGRGYRLVASVQRSTAPTSSPERRRPQASTTPPTAGRPRVSRWAILAASAALISVTVGILAWRRTTSDSTHEVGLAPASIAVMPFANLTGETDKEYFSDGMAAELIDSLAHVPGVKVSARTSVFAYKGRNTDIRQIARDLGVSTILEGSVRSAGERIRVTAELVDARTGFHIWSQTYDRQFSDIFKLQDELTAAIVQALPGRVNTGTALMVRTPPTQDAEAYQNYLQARSAIFGTEESLRRVLTLYDRALARDPRFARAYAERARARMFFLAFGYPLPNALTDAEADALRAVSLDAKTAVARAVLGEIAARRGHWAQAESEFQAAFSTQGVDPETYDHHIVAVLQSTGRMRQALIESIAWFRQAPADRLAAGGLAGAYSLVGRDAEALQIADLAAALGYPAVVPPMSYVYSNAAMRSGHFEEAATDAAYGLPSAVRDAGGAEELKVIYGALADPTKRAAAREAARKLVDQHERAGVAPQNTKNLIVYFVLVGDLDSAYGLVHRTLDQLAVSGTVGTAWGFLWLPEMRAFRQDPRFQQFAMRMRLMEYWKQYGPPDDCDLKDGKLACR